MPESGAGVGVGMLEVARMERALERFPRMPERLFTEAERAWCEAAPLPAEHYAACLAARGAVRRSLGLSGERLGPWDVTVAVDEAGGTHAALAGAAERAAREAGVREVALSLSFTREVAVANAVAVTDAARPRQEARPSAADQLAASFRRARTVLDELDRLQGDVDVDAGGGAGADTDEGDGAKVAPPDEMGA